MKEGELSPALQNALDKFTLDVTAKAKEGKIDPVFGRDTEIRQMVDILSRRRKNNPILVGEPGVGKPHWLKAWRCVLPRVMCLNP
jgi:type VI secretion system protein VasG